MMRMREGESRMMPAATVGHAHAANSGDEASRAAATPLGKRKADESTLNDSERFTKRFNLLSLGERGLLVRHNGRSALTDDAEADANAAHTRNSNYYIPISHGQNTAHPPSFTSAGRPPRCLDDSMQVDDTRDRVYIYNLDEELAEAEEEEPDSERLIFLPDIEKKFSRIPLQVLMGRREDDHEGQELVLYDVPKSLTHSEGSDSVRKAILETRQRAREKALEEARQHDMECKYALASADDAPVDVETAAHGYSAGYAFAADAGQPDADAMEMD